MSKSWSHFHFWVNYPFNSLTYSARLVAFHCWCPQSGNPRECRVWGGGGRRNNSLQYFEFGPQYPFQPLAVNIIYCTFKSVYSLAFPVMFTDVYFYWITAFIWLPKSRTSLLTMTCPCRLTCQQSCIFTTYLYCVIQNKPKESTDEHVGGEENHYELIQLFYACWQIQNHSDHKEPGGQWQMSMHAYRRCATGGRKNSWYKISYDYVLRGWMF